VGKVEDNSQNSNKVESDIIKDIVESDVIMVADEVQERASSWSEADSDIIKGPNENAIAAAQSDVILVDDKIDQKSDVVSNITVAATAPAPSPKALVTADEPVKSMEPASSWSAIASDTDEIAVAPVVTSNPAPVVKENKPALSPAFVPDRVSDDVKDILSASKKFASGGKDDDLYSRVTEAKKKPKANNINTFDNNFMFDNSGAAIGGNRSNKLKIGAAIIALLGVVVGGYIMLSEDEPTSPALTVKNMPVAEKMIVVAPPASIMPAAHVVAPQPAVNANPAGNSAELVFSDEDIEIVDNLDADLDDLLQVEQVEFEDFDITYADWQNAAVNSIPDEIKPRGGLPAMEFKLSHYDMLFDGLRMQVQKIPNGLKFLNGRSDLADSVSIGPAALFVLKTPADQQMVRLNMLYLNLPKFVVSGRQFAEVSLSGVWDADNANLLGNKLHDRYEHALIDRRYKDVSGKSLLSSYEIGLREKNVSDIHKITGKVRLSLPQGVKVEDFLSSDLNKEKSFSEGMNITLLSIDRNAVQLSYDFDKKHLLELWVYDSKGNLLPQKSFKKAGNKVSVSFGAGAGRPSIIRAVAALGFEEKIYPFELSLQ
jgi:hypothetical protein